MRLWERIYKDLCNFGRVFMRICRDLQGFTRLWERIHEDLQDFGRGFVWICRDS